jgi:hypothetical protein
MGSEDEVEQSLGRPKRTCELTSPIVPRGTSFHRSVELEFPPIDPARPSCHCDLLGPAELGAVNPDAVHDHRKQSLYAVLGTAGLSLCHGRGADPRERPSHPGVRLPRFRDRNGASERSAALCQDRRDERGQGLGVRVGTSAAGDCMLRDLSTSRSHKPERARAVLLSALRKIRYAMTSSSQGA